MLRIMTDGAADMPPAWEKEYEIPMIPVNIMFGDKTYLQFVDLDNEGFYKLVDESKKIPKTSQPSPHQFAEFYKMIAQPGDEILSIHVTSKLSGTYASAVAAAEEVKDLFTVYPVDSKAGSAAIGFMCREARRLNRQGRSAQEILQYLERVRERVRIILTLDRLDYARMSGRVGTLQAAVASALNVKPIAVLRDGALNMAERVRTRKASIERVIQLGEEEFGSQPVYLAAVHARDPQSGQGLLDEAKKHFNCKDAILTDLSVSVAANLGPGTVGLVIYPAES
jgi:DegV family protein with EDD domain